MSLPNTSALPPAHTAPAPYEAPAIESVISPSELQREVLYAGVSFLSDPPPIP